MPELAEVEYYRRRWIPGEGKRVRQVFLHGEKRIFRGADPREIPIHLTDSLLSSSETHGKQMLFRFSGGHALGIHLGMTGELRVEGKGYQPQKHDHLVLRQPGQSLVYTDPRLFGRIRLSVSEPDPTWWTDLAPSVLSSEFSQEYLDAFLARRKRSPLKAILLDQAGFPGIGNWMADEILYRARIHPRVQGGALTPLQARELRRQVRHVAREAMRTIAPDWGPPPKKWLFHRRWKDGGVCPETGVGLVRETVGGRTTCWSPGRQKEPR